MNPTPPAGPGTAAEVFFHLSPDLLGVIDAEGRLTAVNPAWQKQLGYAPEDLLGTPCRDLIHPEDRRLLSPPEGAPAPGWTELRVLHRNGASTWMEWGVFPPPTGDGAYVIGRDVSSRRQLEARLGDSDREFYDLVENAADAIWTADVAGRLTSLNRAAERITGYARREVIGRPLASLVAPEHHAMMDDIQARKPGRKSTVFEVDLLHRDGRRIPVELNTRIKYAGGAPVEIQGIARNIMVRKRLIDELRERNEKLRSANRTIHSLMNQDPLTRLPNRRLLESALAQEMAHARREGTPLGLILCDLDRFKQINDGFGHAAGDEVLSAFGSMLSVSCRKQDTPARYGGEEFVILLPDTPLDDALELAERLRAQAESLRVPSGATITVSFGVTALRMEDTVNAFMARADAALYAAKERGRNQVASA